MVIWSIRPNEEEDSGEERGELTGGDGEHGGSPKEAEHHHRVVVWLRAHGR
jgi:hypothetical protein